MKKGWIKFKDDLPPIGLPVIIYYPNGAYGSLMMTTMAIRVNETQMKSGRNDDEWPILTFEIYYDPVKKPTYLTCYAFLWAYDFEENELENYEYPSELGGFESLPNVNS